MEMHYITGDFKVHVAETAVKVGEHTVYELVGDKVIGCIGSARLLESFVTAEGIDLDTPVEALKVAKVASVFLQKHYKNLQSLQNELMELGFVEKDMGGCVKSTPCYVKAVQTNSSNDDEQIDWAFCKSRIEAQVFINDRKDDIRRHNTSSMSASNRYIEVNVYDRDEMDRLTLDDLAGMPVPMLRTLL
ncbi:hypothetical protein [Neptuniibacter sp. QD37_11]|uniref:hypothetical protein n=1 Tax=Neptuniibacter sp. QD37_11 TaxID=3398209 RepID=UPI0039F63E74